MYDFLDKIGLKAVLEAVKGKIPTVSNPNLLINPDFKINQRGISGEFSEIGKYFIDRWKLVSGTVTVNSNGTITLNGSIRQIFETRFDTNVIATVSAGTINTDIVTVSTGGAYVYSVTISAEGETISWAKLEIGSTATPFSPPDPATELMKCYRYFYRVGRDIANPNHTSNFNRICYQNISNKIAGTTLQFPVEMRVTPTASVIGTPWCFRLFTNNGANVVVAGADNVNFNLQKFGYEIVITNDYFANAVDGFIGPLFGSGYTDFDAEIY